jgi:hypothetical protein
MTTVSAQTPELPPGYYVEESTGAWLTLPWEDIPLEESIGYEVLAWCEENLRHHLTGEPWRWTPGQIRFVVQWYRLDGPGPVPRWRWRSGVKRGAKGTGKDPLLAALANAELCGPTTPYWDGRMWHGRQHNLPVVQIAANSEDQAKDPLTVANAMVDGEMASTYGYDKGILSTKLHSGGRIELLTRSEASSEGDPATAIFLNESHHMTETSQGQALARVARRNVGKSPGGMARLLELTNAHMPGEASVAEDSFEAWQAQAAGKTRRQDILYDSREAPPHLSIHDEAQLMEGLRASYADSPWTDLERIRDEAQDPRVSVADSIRFYFSSLPTAADAYIDPRKFDALRLEAVELPDGTPVALFLDCSKSSDATVLCGCRMEDGHVFSIAHWQRPPGARGDTWLAPREDVDSEVRTAFERWDVQWLGVDPSPARDDETEALYWAEAVDAWHRDFRDKVLVWASPGAKIGNSVAFDMRQHLPGGRERLRLFTEEAERTAEAIDEDGTLTWSGSETFRRHVHNARRRPNQWGVSLGKQSRTSSKLIDYAVAMVGARMGRRVVLNSGKTRAQHSGKAVFV